MKQIGTAWLSVIGLSLMSNGSEAQTIAKAPPPGMSWEPSDVWKKVKPATPEDLWPLPAPEEPKPKGKK